MKIPPDVCVVFSGSVLVGGVMRLTGILCQVCGTNPGLSLWLDGAKRVQCGLRVFLLALPDRNALSGICGFKRPPPPKTSAHLDSTRTPQQLVNWLGKHTGKYNQPLLNPLISKSIALPTWKPAQQMTLWTAP